MLDACLMVHGSWLKARNIPVQAQSNLFQAQSRTQAKSKLVQTPRRSRPLKLENRPLKLLDTPVTIDLPFTYQWWANFCVGATKTRSPRVNFCENLMEAGSQKCTVRESLENMSEGLFVASKNIMLKTALS